MCTKLHSDENIHFASQWSSLVSFLMLLNRLLPSSVVGKKTKHIYFPSWAIRKNEPLAFLNIATRRLWAWYTSLSLQLSSVSWQTWNIFTTWVSASGVANLWASRTSWFQQAQSNAQTPNALHFLLTSLTLPQWVSLISLFGAGLSSQLCLPAECDSSSTPPCLGQEGNLKSQGVGLLLVLSLQLK